MKPSTMLLLIAGLAGAAPLQAQSDSTRPNRGKIDGVERDQKKGGSGGGSSSDDCECSGVWFIVRATGELLAHLAAPQGVGRGYERYPYAEADRSHPFVISKTEHGRRFGTLSAQYFDDATSTLSGAQFRFEGVAAAWYTSIEYNRYVEQLATETDRLHSWRVGLGALPHLGRSTMLRVGIAARGVVLDDGTGSLGPELELGVQAFPRRPLGLNVTGRLSHQNWATGGDFTYRELNTTGSLFVGRVEIQAGWHWAKMGSGPAFGGPTIGTRLWF